jgi:hypothetical protein
MLKSPFTAIYDEEVLSDQLVLYDWLHLHHEDFRTVQVFDHIEMFPGT